MESCGPRQIRPAPERPVPRHLLPLRIPLSQDRRRQGSSQGRSCPAPRQPTVFSPRSPPIRGSRSTPWCRIRLAAARHPTAATALRTARTYRRIPPNETWSAGRHDYCPFKPESRGARGSLSAPDPAATEKPPLPPGVGSGLTDHYARPNSRRALAVVCAANSSRLTPRSSARQPAVCTMLAGSFLSCFPRRGCGTR
jgi:hypothetical protein